MNPTPDRPTYASTVKAFRKQKKWSQRRLGLEVEKVTKHRHTCSRQPISNGEKTNTWSRRFFRPICEVMGLEHVTVENASDYFVVDGWTSEEAAAEKERTLAGTLGEIQGCLAEAMEMVNDLAAGTSRLFGMMGPESNWGGTTTTLLPNMFEFNDDNKAMIEQVFGAISRGTNILFFTPSRQFIKDLEEIDELNNLESYEDFDNGFKDVFRSRLIPWLQEKGMTEFDATRAAWTRANRYDADRFPLVSARETLSMLTTWRVDGEKVQRLFYRGFTSPCGMEGIHALPRDERSLERFSHWMGRHLDATNKALKRKIESTDDGSDERQKIQWQLQFIREFLDRTDKPPSLNDSRWHPHI
ncbi:hypothetical protein [Zavarzinella formosa]|uniref:hypothetical protein n=1 Tax=Zavarzinella formosa TaxID=360055 RepID=UPI000311719B|nr:hypothetical protein [Zavarzinella formosa]